MQAVRQLQIAVVGGISLLLTSAGPADAGTRPIEHPGLMAAVHRLEDPDTTCAQLTKRYIASFYGGKGRRGRENCQRSVDELSDEGASGSFEQIQIESIDSRTASVRIRDSDRNTGNFEFVKRPRGWLVLSIRQIT
jgi:hypothetical protein